MKIKILKDQPGAWEGIDVHLFKKDEVYIIGEYPMSDILGAMFLEEKWAEIVVEKVVEPFEPELELPSFDEVEDDEPEEEYVPINQREKMVKSAPQNKAEPKKKKKKK